MIKYERGCWLWKILQCRGSVVPMGVAIAAPCAVATAVLRVVMDLGYLLPLTESDGMQILRDSSVWGSFTFLLGFLIVFRTGQAYARFWDGCTSTHQMRAEWYDACSSLFAFCKDSSASLDEILRFQHLVVRLFSMLHAVALADIEDSNKERVQDVAAFRYELVDGVGLDVDSLRALKKSDAKVELIFQWIQQVIVEAIGTGVLSIPPPILSRSFQEIANGMVAFHDAIKISTIPFPFPYAQMCELLLLMHWVVTPIVISQYVETPWWGALFTFLQVFVYWSLNAIAVEIENPFGMDANDIDAAGMQEEMNRHLLLLLEPTTKKTPSLSRPMTRRITAFGEHEDKTFTGRASLLQIWEEIDHVSGQDALPVRRRNLGSTYSNASGMFHRTSQTSAMSHTFSTATDDTAKSGRHSGAHHAIVAHTHDRLTTLSEDLDKELDCEGVDPTTSASGTHDPGRGSGGGLGSRLRAGGQLEPVTRPHGSRRSHATHHVAFRCSRSSSSEGLGADEAPSGGTSDEPDDQSSSLAAAESNAPPRTLSPRKWPDSSSNTGSAEQPEARWHEHAIGI